MCTVQCVNQKRIFNQAYVVGKRSFLRTLEVSPFINHLNLKGHMNTLDVRSLLQDDAIEHVEMSEASASDEDRKVLEEEEDEVRSSRRVFKSLNNNDKVCEVNPNNVHSECSNNHHVNYVNKYMFQP